MGIEINLQAVGLAAVITMLLGWWWYLPGAFGDTWMRLAKIDRRRLNSNLALAVAAISLVAMAFALACVAYMLHVALGHSFFVDSMLASVFVWGGFQVLRLWQLAEFNQRSHAETAIHAGNELMTAVVMAVVIGLMGY